jgi:alkanesulfonate monooxygenase SsuD/methylene tetrahydromethanopterin reductase-like flavin-dependent oxidoreductase (luciferase family)
MGFDTKFGVYIANHGIFADPQDYIELSIIAEGSNWDGFFIWDHMHLNKDSSDPVLDPWIVLAGIATKTEKLRIGTTVTALARRRPWKIARETVSLDRLSNGRLVLGVGLGVDNDFSDFGEDGDSQVRGKKLDETLDILTGLWTGQPFSYQGEFYKLNEVKFIPKPVQKPIPIWVGGTWPNKKPFRRAAKYNGIFPLREGFEEHLWTSDMKEIIKYIKLHREASEPFDVIHTVVTSTKKEENQWIHDYIEAGVTWIVECFYPGRGSTKDIQQIVKKGPPV